MSTVVGHGQYEQSGGHIHVTVAVTCSGSCSCCSQECVLNLLHLSSKYHALNVLCNLVSLSFLFSCLGFHSFPVLFSFSLSTALCFCVSLSSCIS